MTTEEDSFIELHKRRYIVYSKPGCVWCVRAKELLTREGLEYREVILDVGQEKDPTATYMSIMEFKDANPTVRSLPYILADEQLEYYIPIGGYKELEVSLQN